MLAMASSGSYKSAGVFLPGAALRNLDNWMA